MAAREYLIHRVNHLCCQLLGVFINSPPSIRLTPAARAALLTEMSTITAFEPVATIMCSQPPDSADRDSDRPYWVVTFYDKWARPSGRITQVEGVPFVF